MEKKKRRSLRNILAVAFTFAMVMVFAGLVGKVDAKAGTTTCSMTIYVKDAKGNLIENATPFVDIWEPVTYRVYKINRTLDTCVKNDDGSYTFTIEWDSTPTGEYNDPKEGLFVATPGADAPGYKINRMANTDPYNVGYGVDGFRLKEGNEYGEEYNNSPYTVVLTAQTDEERLAETKTTEKKKLNDYKKKSDYGEEEWKQVQNIINKYKDSIDAIEISDELTVQEAEAKIAEYVTAAKAEMDQVVTAQSKTNDSFADYISFVSADGSTTRVLAGSNGKYAITMSMQDKGGFFRVNCKEDTTVTWNAGRFLPASESGMGADATQEYIGNTYDKGMFLSDKNSVNNPYIVTTLKNCSVTFTPADGKDEVTVVFDLVVKESLIKDLAVQAEEKVTLTRNDDLEYITVLRVGEDYSVVANYDNGKQVADGIGVESLDPEIATVDEKLRIKPLKAGTVTFRATFEDETGTYTEEFEIEFVMSAKEQKEIADAEAVEKLIAALGNVTLAKESDVQAARDAYDKLSDNAKLKVNAEKLTTLTSAEKKVSTLKAEKAAAEKAAAEKAAAEKAAAEKAAAEKAAAEKAKAEAIKKNTPSAPKWKSAKSVKKKTATLTWKKSSKATGYEIYMSTKKNSGYKKVATVKNGKKVTYTKKSLKGKKTYYFKIKAYKKVGKTTYRSAYSAVKKVKVKAK